MKIMITGGAGFIGSHLVDSLVKGHDVLVIDNLSAEVHEQFYFNDRAEYFHVDVTDYHKCKPVFNGVDVVFHLAARSRIQPSLVDPVETIRTNVLGTEVMLQLAHENRVKLFVFSSSSSVYGNINPMPLQENMPTDCLNPYSNSKLMGEQLCAMYSRLFDLPTVALRYFNVYGPREPLKGPYATVVGKFIQQRFQGQPLTLVGTGQQRRDFTHVSDVVSAMISLMHADHEFSGTVLNVGTGTNYSVKQLADMIWSNQIMIASRSAEANQTLADPDKIQKICGWTHKVALPEYIKAQINEN